MVAVVLTLTAAARKVARCRGRYPASASVPEPACTARPGVPPIRTLLTTASALAIVRH